MERMMEVLRHFRGERFDPPSTAAGIEGLADFF